MPLMGGLCRNRHQDKPKPKSNQLRVNYKNSGLWENQKKDICIGKETPKLKSSGDREDRKKGKERYFPRIHPF